MQLQRFVAVPTLLVATTTVWALVAIMLVNATLITVPRPNVYQAKFSESKAAKRLKTVPVAYGKSEAATSTVISDGEPALGRD